MVTDIGPHGANNSSGTRSFAVTTPVSAGALIVVATYDGNNYAVTGTSVSDSENNTYTLVESGLAYNEGGAPIAIWYRS